MNTSASSECYISVDVETAGPNPSQYSLLTIGACTIRERPRTFYVELKPINEKMTSEAYATHRLDIKRLVREEQHLPLMRRQLRFMASIFQ